MAKARSEDTMPEPTQDEFNQAVADLIGEWFSKGLHLMDMIPPLEKELAWAKENLARIDAGG